MSARSHSEASAWVGEGTARRLAGVQLFYLSRLMGTSVEMISQTYGHLVPDSEEYLRGILDNYDRGNELLARSGR